MDSYKDFTVYVASRRPELVSELQLLVPEARYVYFDEHNSRCFSHIVNTLIIKCPTEYIIFLSDKCRPCNGQLEKMKDLMLTGDYGMVSLHRFGAFCLDKDLVRKIGLFDERYIRGGFEDDDYAIRIREVNVAIYISEEMPLLQLPSSFKYEAPYIHFKEKWAFQPTKTIRLQKEEDLRPEYSSLYTSRPENRPSLKFRGWGDSVFLVKGHHNYQKYGKPVVNFIITPIYTRLIPPLIETIPHIAFLKLFASIIQPKVYVEYGVRNGASFNSVVEETRAFGTRCIGVDLSEILNKHPRGEYYQLSTNEFAETVLPELGIIVDMVFIDACHSRDQSFTDFKKIFPYVAEDGLILMHDTYPLNEMFTSASWCGNTYLAAWDIRKSEYYKQRAEIITLPVHPGLTIIRKSSRQLFWKESEGMICDICTSYLEL